MGKQQQTNIFYNVKITQGYYEYTCELSDLFYNQAIHEYGEHVKLNIEGMNVLLVVLKRNKASIFKKLRSLMLKYIHHKQPLDELFILNFRNRVAIYRVRNLEYQDVSMEHT